MQVITEDHYSPPTVYAPAKVTLTRQEIGTRYVMTAVRNDCLLGGAVGPRGGN